MANVFDVAAYILAKKGEMSAVKLQKLVYYSQAWSLVWDDAPLFDQRIEAWVHGPVAPDLYNWARKRFSVAQEHMPPNANPEALTAKQKVTVDAVLAFYGDKDSQWLSDLSHMEAPWKNARAGLGPAERSNRPITLKSMAEYYSSLR